MRVGVHLIFQNLNRLSDAEKFRRNFKDRIIQVTNPYVRRTPTKSRESATIILTKCSCPLRSTMSSVGEFYRI
jgi:hypothetical protein